MNYFSVLSVSSLLDCQDGGESGVFMTSIERMGAKLKLIGTLMLCLSLRLKFGLGEECR